MKSTPGFETKQGPFITQVKKTSQSSREDINNMLNTEFIYQYFIFDSFLSKSESEELSILWRALEETYYIWDQSLEEPT